MSLKLRQQNYQFTKNSKRIRPQQLRASFSRPRLWLRICECFAHCDYENVVITYCLDIDNRIRSEIVESHHTTRAQHHYSCLGGRDMLKLH